MKTKYERMKPYEKKKVIETYKKTSVGSVMMKRLFRLNCIGAALILYAVFFFIKDITHLNWMNYCISLPIFCIGFFFIIMAYRLRKKVLNNFAIKNK